MGVTIGLNMWASLLFSIITMSFNVAMFNLNLTKYFLVTVSYGPHFLLLLHRFEVQKPCHFGYVHVLCHLLRLSNFSAATTTLIARLQLIGK